MNSYGKWSENPGYVSAATPSPKVNCTSRQAGIYIFTVENNHYLLSSLGGLGVQISSPLSLAISSLSNELS